MAAECRLLIYTYNGPKPALPCNNPLSISPLYLKHYKNYLLTVRLISHRLIAQEKSLCLGPLEFSMLVVIGTDVPTDVLYVLTRYRRAYVSLVRWVLNCQFQCDFSGTLKTRTTKQMIDEEKRNDSSGFSNLRLVAGGRNCLCDRVTICLPPC